MGVIRDLKYKVVKNFLSEDELRLARRYMLQKHNENYESFDFLQNNNCDSYFVNDPLSESLLFIKQKKMEEETGLELYPTYSFARLYTYNAELKPHLDRPSCEISVTVMFGSSGENWPIYMGDKPIELNPGDACIYLGCEVNHSRKNFTGDWHSQAFLHYVDKNGPHADYKFDKRPIDLDFFK